MMLGLTLGLTALAACSDDDDDPTPSPGTLGAAASTGEIDEGSPTVVVLEGSFSAGYQSAAWSQVAGPKAGLSNLAGLLAHVSVADLDVAADQALAFELRLVDLDGKAHEVQLPLHVRALDMVAGGGAGRQLGGATTAVAYLDARSVTALDVSGEWALYNVANRLLSAPLRGTALAGSEVVLQGFVRDIDVVDFEGRRYALAALGAEGVAAVDVTNPSALELRATVAVNHFKGDLETVNFRGEPIPKRIYTQRAPIVALETDGETLWIANEGFGIHRTALANLLAASGPVTERDRTLWIDAEVFTLQFASEQPWGGPQALELYEGRLYAALGALGLGVYDAQDLSLLGRYNLYTDPQVVEDWFLDLDVARAVQPGGLDPQTGMPNHVQAGFEIREVWSGEQDAPTPWTEFQRHGRFYYEARDVAVARHGPRTIAYVASGLGGLVAVEVQATKHAGALGTYLAQVPAVPAIEAEELLVSPQHAPLAPVGKAAELAEAGVNAVTVFGPYVYYTDHAAGLVMVRGAEDPKAWWHGGQPRYDNDTNGIPGDHVPPYEFVRGYDMRPLAVADAGATLAWMRESPALLVSGVPAGCACGIALLDTEGAIVCPKGPPYALDTFEGTPDRPPLPPALSGEPDAAWIPGPAAAPADLASAGPHPQAGHQLLPRDFPIDVVIAAGSGGLQMLDVGNLREAKLADRFERKLACASTDELYAEPDAACTHALPIGDTTGLAASGEHLYLADGPHGVTAWRLVDEHGYPAGAPRLVGNSLQAEAPCGAIQPSPDASALVLDLAKGEAMTLCQTHGMRCVPLGDVEAGLGQPGAPVLMAMDGRDLFEHTLPRGSLPGLEAQDGAFGAVVEGDLVYVADGKNGLTIYDVTKNPQYAPSGFLVANLVLGDPGAEPAPALDLALWSSPDARRYAFLALGERGMGIVDVTHPTRPWPPKPVQPVLPGADVRPHRVLDVTVVGDLVFFACGAEGVACYDAADLLAPVAASGTPGLKSPAPSDGVALEARRRPLARFHLRDVPGYEGRAGEAVALAANDVGGVLQLYVAWGTAGVARVDWSDPWRPRLVQLAETVGEAVGLAIAQGRVWVADHAGGLAWFE